MTITLDIVDEINLQTKLSTIRDLLNDKKVIVAYSGGVDSSVVAHLSKIYAKSSKLVMQIGASVPKDEMELAKSQSVKIGLPLEFIEYDEIDYSEEYTKNDPDRCYHCKTLLYGFLEQIKDESDYDLVLSGTNFSDLDGHRPGFKASEEIGILNPLVLAKITKPEVRHIARTASLPSADKPATACLASRVMTGIAISKERLNRIERSEKWLRKEFDLSVLRVRDHGELARIEVGQNELHKILDLVSFELINKTLRSYGFQQVSIDTKGYRPSIPLKKNN